MCRTDFYTFVKCQNLLKTTPFFGTNAVCEHYGNWNHCKSADAGINAGSACSEKLISLGFFFVIAMLCDTQSYGNLDNILSTTCFLRLIVVHVTKKPKER